MTRQIAIGAVVGFALTVLLLSWAEGRSGAMPVAVDAGAPRAMEARPPSRAREPMEFGMSDLRVRSSALKLLQVDGDGGQ